MSDMEIISETPINIYILKKEIDMVKKRDKELDFRAAKTEEYLNNTGAYDNAEQLFDKIMKLNIPRLKENQIHKIIDIMPPAVKDLKVVLQAYPITISNEGMKKIAETISEFIGKTEKK